MEPETPLKGRGGELETGWEAWRADGALLGVGLRKGGRPSARGGALPASHSSPPLGPAATPRVGPSSSPPVVPLPPWGFTIFFFRELSWGQGLSWRVRGAPTEHVMNFLRVNLALEPFLTFGHALCVDMFLFHFTLLPLRAMSALRGLCVCAARSLSRRGGGGGIGGVGEAGKAPRFSQAQAYDLLKCAILLAATLALGAVQVSRVYHYIRGEAIIKLCVCALLRTPQPPRPPHAPLSATPPPPPSQLRHLQHPGDF